jgi:choice-of-anchor C domain-containing protein
MIDAISVMPPNLVKDGGFERPIVVRNGYQGQLGAWTIGAGNVDVQGNHVAAEGEQSLDLDGTNDRGEIHQDLATIPGHSYTLTFALAGNTEGLPVTKTLAVAFGATTQTYTFDTTGHSGADMGWTTKTLTITATAPTTRLSFRSTDAIVFPQSYGPMIDEVWVSQA